MIDLWLFLLLHHFMDVIPYLLSTEIFNELKYEIIETMIKFLVTVYMASISKTLERIFCTKYSEKIIEEIEEYIKDLMGYVNTRGGAKCDTL